MHVHFVSRARKHLVSYRQRIAEPTKYLIKQGWSVTSGDWIPADAHIFAKHWNPEDVFHAKASNCPIFDVCDDHFGTEHDAFYREMCAVANTVVTSSAGLAEIVERECRRKATVIHEPYEFKEGTPRNPGEPLKVLWHGHSANIESLARVFEGLPFDLMKEFRVVCNIPVETSGKIRGYSWRLEEMPGHLEWCDVIIIPQDRFWKSPNKMIEGIRAGRFVIASDIPAYRGYGMYLGDVTKGLKWLKGQNVVPDIQRAQALIRDKFSPETIGKQWFDCISAAVQRSSIGLDSSTATSSAMLM